LTSHLGQFLAVGEEFDELLLEPLDSDFFEELGFLFEPGLTESAKLRLFLVPLVQLLLEVAGFRLCVRELLVPLCEELSERRTLLLRQLSLILGETDLRSLAKLQKNGVHRTTSFGRIL